MGEIAPNVIGEGGIAPQNFISEGGIAPQNGEKCQRHLSHASLDYCIVRDSKASKTSKLKTNQYKHTTSFLSWDFEAKLGQVQYWWPNWKKERPQTGLDNQIRVESNHNGEGSLHCWILNSSNKTLITFATAILPGWSKMNRIRSAMNQTKLDWSPNGCTSDCTTLASV